MVRMAKRAGGVLALTAVLLGASAAHADAEAPKIEHTPLTEFTRGKAVALTAKISDPDGIFEPVVYYRRAGTSRYQTVSLVQSGATWTATLPVDVSLSDFEYFLEAYDGNGNGPSRSGSDTAPHRVRAVDPEAKPLVVAPPPPEKKPEPEVKVARPTSDDDLRDDRPASSTTTTLKQSGKGLGGMFIAGAAMAGTGVLVAAAGGYFGLQARSARQDAVGERSAVAASAKLSEARSNATRANVAFVAGGLLAAGGAVLMLLPGKPADDGMHATLLLAPGSAGAAIGGTF